MIYGIGTDLVDLDRIKKMLTSIETTSKLFTQLDIKHDIRRAD